MAFGGVWKESLSELSGGQKSLLALSLILAMLLFKPAPIYILDEVRSHLDWYALFAVCSVFRPPSWLCPPVCPSSAPQVDAALDLSHTQNIGRMIKQHFPQSQVRLEAVVRVGGVGQQWEAAPGHRLDLLDASYYALAR